MTHGIILTADDYGIAPGVGASIRDLLDRAHLSATGCMVVSSDFAEEGQLLRPYLDRADVGLHLTLTHNRNLGPLMLEAFSRRLNPRDVAAEVDRQVAAFQRVIGRLPTFIDGHHHVHLLPVVRDAVAEAAMRTGAYLRLTDEPLSRILRAGVAVGKAVSLSLLSRPLAREVARRGLVRNRGFRGVRSFAEPGPFGDLFRRMIKGAQTGTIVMCHPGHVDNKLRANDPVTVHREEEYRYLASEELPADLSAAGLHLARLKEALEAAL